MNKIGLQTLIVREVKRFMRVYIQALISPWISALLYIIVFGIIIGSRIDTIAGVTYIDFVLPGIVMLNLIQASYQQGGFGLYMHRFQRSIEEILVSPLSYLEMLIGFIIASVFRGMVVGLGVYFLALMFTSASMSHFGLFLFYSIGVSIIFSLVGLIVGMWAKNFEQLTILTTFVIIPLTFLGGVFNSITMLPEKVQIFLKINPFFYFVDGLRYSMIGVSESNIMVGYIIIISLILSLGFLVWHLFKIGWKIRV